MTTADQVIDSLRGLDYGSIVDEVERIRARDALFEALRKVQSPWDIVWDQNWVHGATHACVKTFIDAGVFKKWAEAAGEAMTSAELAQLTGMEEELVSAFNPCLKLSLSSYGGRLGLIACQAGRMMRHLAGQNLVIEMGEDVFARTPWAKTLADDPSLMSIYGTFFSDNNNPMFQNLPFFLKERGYKNPSDVSDCNWQHWRGSKNNLFEDLAINPSLASSFHDAMVCHSKYNQTSWPNIYPTETIVAAAKSGRALVVDVGGSKGHDLEKFRLLHPNIPDNSLILQDLPDVIQESHVDKAISPQAYNFFTPQPVKGARVYFMHIVLHDWTDDLALQIIKNVASGMERGYSRLLVHESVITPMKTLARVTTSDLTMMACLASKERTEGQWRNLINSAGLQIIKIWRSSQFIESIIEAELV